MSSTARRAGWVGCNISIQSIPEAGKIFYIKNSKVEPKQKIINEWHKTNFLKTKTDLDTRGWIVDVMYCIDGLRKKEFTLTDVYRCEKYFEVRHPNNKHIKDKIRQQLQVLRDKGYLDFVSTGLYRLI